MKKIILATLSFLTVFNAVAQKRNGSFQYHIHKTTSPIKIDGILDEDGWQKAQVASDFFMVLPMDTAKAAVRTEVRMTYDDKNIYVTFINYDKLPGPYTVESLRRDFTFGKNDNDLLFIDTFNDLTNGFSFGANAAGAEWDGVMSEGSKINLSWENKWTSSVKADDDKWIWEAAIPFKTIRYKKGISEWGINFSRLDMKTTEKSSWTPIPRQFPTASLAFTGVLVWDTPPPAAGTNISIIPYLSGGVSKDFQNNGASTFKRDIGFDAKIGLSSSLNLDLTVNPDFSQVEVDQQQTNLDRFELFYPERRQFFLENGDLFASFGYSDIRPFFSRRIGLNAPINAGARLSGKINKDWRIGVMDMQTGKSDTLTPSQNFGVFALQRRIFARSNIGVIFVNKESLDFQSFTDGLKDKKRISSFNRTFGLEYNLASANNIWSGKAFFFKSIDPQNTSDNQVIAANLQHTAKRLTWGFEYNYVGENYNAEVGYVPRKSYNNFFPTASYLFFPKSLKVLSHGPTASMNLYFDKTLSQQTDNEAFMGYRVSFLNRAELLVWTAYNYVKLLNAFDPTNYTNDKLAKGTEHNWKSFGFDYTSKPQSLFTYALSTRYGGYYANGNRLRITSELGYRFQPFVAITMTANYNHLEFFNDAILPKNLQNRDFDFWLVGPRIDVTLSKRLFFTNYLQYNNQAKNVNLNTRLQWRYSPASDLYIVYTDNYLPDNLQVKTRALVLKFTYWWNV